MAKDKVYSQAQAHIVDFAFTSEVADVFPDMIRRSVPGYETVIPLTGLIAARELVDHDLVLDLGCSLGATSQALLSQSTLPNIRVVGVDNSQPMIDRAQALNQDRRAEFVLADIKDIVMEPEYQGAKVILLNFVLQFFDPGTRMTILQGLKDLLCDNGLLIISEKVKNRDADLHAFYDQTHLAWKQANGYSGLEISQKRTALENVMIVDDIENADMEVGRFVNETDLDDTRKVAVIGKNTMPGKSRAPPLGAPYCA